MPDSTRVCERPLATQSTVVAPVARAGRPGPAWPLVAMATGLMVLALAGAAVAHAAPAARPPTGANPVIAPDPTAITVSARDVSVVTQVYEPGQYSGWHQHSGIHAVAVLSGVLTVYDGACHAETYEPGRPYVGGQQAHLVGNETDAPVTMTVTYLGTSRPTTSTEHVPAPTGCTAG